jgi:hypothetical protein
MTWSPLEMIWRDGRGADLLREMHGRSRVPELRRSEVRLPTKMRRAARWGAGLLAVVGILLGGWSAPAHAGVGWYLMEPPIRWTPYDLSPFGNDWMEATTGVLGVVPLSEWHQRAEFDNPTACQKYKGKGVAGWSDVLAKAGERGLEAFSVLMNEKSSQQEKDLAEYNWNRYYTVLRLSYPSLLGLCVATDDPRLQHPSFMYYLRPAYFWPRLRALWEDLRQHVNARKARSWAYRRGTRPGEPG